MDHLIYFIVGLLGVVYGRLIPVMEKVSSGDKAITAFDE